MFELRETPTFIAWMKGLKDREARARINIQLRKVGVGNFGNVKGLGSGLFEMRVDYGPGYRVYFNQQGSKIIILLCGGVKTGQQKDINRARLLVRKFDDED